MKHEKIGLSGLIYTGIGSIVGSGWLMSAYIVAQNAGPSAIISWIVGAAIIAIIALNFIEVCSFFPPVDGGFGSYIEYTHNSFLSFVSDWVFLLSWIGLIPAEASATVQYLSSLLPWKHLILLPNNDLTMLGTVVSGAVCLLFFIINYASLTVLMRWVKFLTLFKIFVPIVVAVTLLTVAHKFTNLGTNMHQFMPYGYHGLLQSITTAGVVFAFVGFQTPVTFASVAANPKRNIPLAIIFSVVFCTIIYFLLQLAYLLAVPSADLINNKGWQTLNYAAPFFRLSKIYHLHVLLCILSVVAFVAPFSAGLVFFASAARITTGFNKYLPRIISKENENGIPVGSLFFVLGVCWMILYILPGWQMIVSVICTSLVILFAIICLVNGTLNKFVKKEKMYYGIYIKGSDYFSFFGFIASSLMYFWSSWPLTWKGLVVVGIGIPFYFFFQSTEHGFRISIKNFLGSIWLLFYIASIALISYLSPFGGISCISALSSQSMVIAAAAIFYFVGFNNGALNEILKSYVVQLADLEKENCLSAK